MSAQGEWKVCRGCGVTFLFVKTNWRVRFYCTDECRKYARAHRKRRKYDLEKQRIRARRKYHRYPDKTKARRAVRWAVHRGVLQKRPCQECGEPNAVAHHHRGYEREAWLDVKWLCQPHHHAEHVR